MDMRDRIFRLLTIQHHTQTELANHLGVTRAMVSEWKRSKCESYRKYLPEIAEFLSISIDELVFGANNESVISSKYGDVLSTIHREHISPEELEIAVDFILAIRKNTTPYNTVKNTIA